MKRLTTTLSLLIILTTGCASKHVVGSGDLPVYGTDPLQHTTYLGSDDRFHHFSYQNGKSGGEVLVRCDDAVITPQPFALDSGQSAFVRGTRPGEIELIVLSK